MGFIVCLVGTDGSGKTTQAKMLVAQLNRKGCPAKYLWFRFPYFLTLIVLFTAKVTGFTRKVSNDKKLITIHSFHLQPFRMLYPVVLLFDLIANNAIKVWVPSKLGYVVVCDRGIYDIIVDISVETNNRGFYLTSIGRVLSNLANRARVTLFFDAPDNVLLARRPESRFDPNAQDRRFLYRFLAELYSIPKVFSSTRSDILFKDLLGIVEPELKIEPKRQGSMDHYVPQVQLPLLWSLLKNKYVIIAINWTFQGMLIAVWSERLFRILLELTFAAVIYTPFLILTRSPVLGALISLLIAHTINYLFNSCNPLGVLKFSGWTFSVEKNITFLQDVKPKVKGIFRNSVLAIALFGSISRGQFSETSDIDMRMVRNHGLLNYAVTNIFAFYLRSLAFLKKIPLDLFVLDNVNQVAKQIKPEESPIIIYDPTNAFRKVNRHTIPLEEIAPQYRLITPT
jgi:thymidylate kinase/predicted nucleotidyltransferase